MQKINGRDLFKLLLLVAIALISGCQTQSADLSNLERQECEADSDFAFVTGGQFIRGSDRTERDFAYNISARAIAQTEAGIEQAEQKLRQIGWFDGEKDRTTASTNSYCISINLVTNQDYQEFVRATNYPSPNISAAQYQQQSFLVHDYSKVKEFLWKNSTYPQDKAQHPVVLISYNDALAYAEWKGTQTGTKYRLPTALEWEKAARGKSGNYFPWGNDWQAEATNFGGNNINYTTAIATYPLSKSVYGVEDMAGNIFEYTSTVISVRNKGLHAVMKGCSWDDLPGFCRAAYQHTRPVNSRHILFGFRLVKVE